MSIARRYTLYTLLLMLVLTAVFAPLMSWPRTGESTGGSPVKLSKFTSAIFPPWFRVCG